MAHNLGITIDKNRSTNHPKKCRLLSDEIFSRLPLPLLAQTFSLHLHTYPPLQTCRRSTPILENRVALWFGRNYAYADAKDAVDADAEFMLILWSLAVAPGVTHFGAYHHPPDNNLFTLNVEKEIEDYKNWRKNIIFILRSLGNVISALAKQSEGQKVIFS